MNEFIAKLDKLDDKELAQELLELFLINPDEAYKQYRIALARKILDENQSLFRRLSKL